MIANEAAETHLIQQTTVMYKFHGNEMIHKQQLILANGTTQTSQMSKHFAK